MRGASFVLALVVAAALGGALGWASRGAPAPDRPREGGSAVSQREEPPEARALEEKRAALERERSALSSGSGADTPPVAERVAPRTLDQHLDFLSKIILRKATSDAWTRSVDRFEAALASDPAMLTEFLAILSKPGDRRSFALTVLKEMSHDFLSRPEIAAFARALAQDESAQVMDRVLALGLFSACWEAEDPSAWATLSGLAQFDKEEMVRQVALSKLQGNFEDDPRTKRLLSESWWKEAEPQARAARLLSMLPSLDPAERSETIARALREDRATEVKAAAASQLFQDLLAPERPMTPDQRRASVEAALGELTPHADRGLRQVLLMSALAAGDESQLRATAEYLATREPDAKLKAWGESTVKKLLEPGAARDEEFLRSLWDSIKALGDDEER